MHSGKEVGISKYKLVYVGRLGKIKVKQRVIGADCCRETTLRILGFSTAAAKFQQDVGKLDQADGPDQFGRFHSCQVNAKLDLLRTVQRMHSQRRPEA
jgi:hypothetical protein